MSGLHFADCRHTWWTRLWTNKAADDQILARKLWELSEEIVGIKDNVSKKILKKPIEKPKGRMKTRSIALEVPMEESEELLSARRRCLELEEYEDLVSDMPDVSKQKELLESELSMCVQREIDVFIVRTTQDMQRRILSTNEEQFRGENMSRGR